MYKKFNRKSIRINGYDYSQEGMYFITICTRDRKCILANVGADASVRPKLTSMGIIVNECIYNIKEIYEGVRIEKYVIMPNHIHMIIYIGRTEASAPTKDNTRNKVSFHKKVL